MISSNNDNLIEIKLSKEEQRAILKYCQLYEPVIQGKIESSSDGIVYLLDYEADILITVLCSTAQEISDEKIKSMFYKLADKMPLSDSTAKILERFARVDFTDIEEFQRVWDEVDEEQKNTPNPRIGNLTSNQLKKLQYANWAKYDCPIKFNKDLSLDELSQSTFFSNTRLFLKKLLEFSNETTATAKGNLNRKFVKIMFDEMDLDEDYRDSTLRYNKVLNETDVLPLHISRVVSEQAGLVKKRSKKFFVVNKHMPLLSDEWAGELYYLLFYTYFKKFNLAYFGRLPELEGIQETMDYSLYILSKVCNEYQTIDSLVQKIFLPAILREIREYPLLDKNPDWIVLARIVRPLRGFGLLECKYKDKGSFAVIDRVRKAPLFDKFMKFCL